MKKLMPQFLLSSVLAPVLFLAATSFSAFAQEYDDLYFTPGDRKKAKFLNESENVESNIIQQEQYSADEDVDLKRVNPDNMVKYNRGVSSKRYQKEDTVDYYVEDYERDRNVVINNYYGSGYSNYYYNPYRYSWNRWGYDPYYYDPFYDPFWSFGPSWGWHSGLYISLGWNSFRRPWYYGYHSPYYYDYYGSYYSSWYSPYYYSPYYGHNHYFYNYSYYTVNKNTVYYDRGSDSYRTRNVTRGSYTPRSSSTALANGSTVTRRTVSPESQSANGRIANYRDHSTAQNDYYRRTRSDATPSRTSVNNTGNSSVRSSSVQTANTSSTLRRSTDYYNTRSFDTQRQTPSNNANSYRSVQSSGQKNAVSTSPSNARMKSETPSRSTYTPARERSSIPSSGNFTPARRNTGTERSVPSRSYSPSRSESYTPSRSTSPGSYSPSRSYSSPSRSSGSSGSSYSPSRGSYSSGGGSTPSRSYSSGSSSSSSGGSRRSR